jgi:hypothetical protein
MLTLPLHQCGVVPQRPKKENASDADADADDVV